MKYYFFQTVKDGKLRLRPLSGQTMEDGTPIDPTLNVQSPDEADKYVHGARNDYPEGTRFCSTHIEIKDRGTKRYYSVLTGNLNDTEQDFYPVSDNPNFRYKDSRHRNNEMNLAYTSFLNGMELKPSPKTQEKIQKKMIKKNTKPYDEKGNAVPMSVRTAEAYSGQNNLEDTIYCVWIKRIFNQAGAKGPVGTIGSCTGLFDNMHRCNESLDTICRRERFDIFCNKSAAGIRTITLTKPAVQKDYLEWIRLEHVNAGKTTATATDSTNVNTVRDFISLLSVAFNGDLSGEDGFITKDMENDMRTALDNGWTLSDMINPDNIGESGAAELKDYLQCIASGKLENRHLNSLSPLEKLLMKYPKPQDSKGFHIDDNTWRKLMCLIHSNTNIMLTGPTGSGKTELAKIVATTLNLPLTIVQMGSITDPTEMMVGKMDLNEKGGTSFDWAPFALAIQKPGIVLLDEVNRIPRNGENILFGCLDDTRELNASNAKEKDCRSIKVHPECHFIGTANIGDEYSGTNEIDPAMKTRFEFTSLDYMTEEQESLILNVRTSIPMDEARQIAKAASMIRKTVELNHYEPLSTRQSITCAKMYMMGYGDILECIEASMIARYSNEGEKTGGRSEQTTLRSSVEAVFNNTKRA